MAHVTHDNGKFHHHWDVSRVRDEIRALFERDDDFEGFLYKLTFCVFCLLFMRILVALYLGRWGLFE